MSASETIDPRPRAALERQLELREEAFARGARHIGWKLGMGERERISGEIAVGHITSETVATGVTAYRMEPGARLHVDAEAVFELGDDVTPGEPVAVEAVHGGLEVVDLQALDGEPDAVVAANVFHRAALFARLGDAEPAALEVSLDVNGHTGASARWPADLEERLWAAARVLASVGEKLRGGDFVLTGSIVQVPVGPGDTVVARFGELNRIELAVTD